MVPLEIQDDGIGVAALVVPLDILTATTCNMREFSQVILRGHLLSADSLFLQVRNARHSILCVRNYFCK
jgi:hypothetical protein